MLTGLSPSSGGGKSVVTFGLFSVVTFKVMLAAVTASVLPASVTVDDDVTFKTKLLVSIAALVVMLLGGDVVEAVVVEGGLGSTLLLTVVGLLLILVIFSVVVVELVVVLSVVVPFDTKASVVVELGGIVGVTLGSSTQSSGVVNGFHPCNPKQIYNGVIRISSSRICLIFIFLKESLDDF